MKRLIPLTLLVISVAPAAAAQTAERIARIESAVLPRFIIRGEAPATTTLAERMEALRVPGVSVAVIHDGKLEWARGYGLADVESGRPVTRTTIFQAASISKPLAAVGALHLVERGWLDLDTDINGYLTTWKLPDNEFTENTPVTVRGLLTHTAGTTVWGFPGYTRTTQPMPTAVDVLDGKGNTDPIRVYKEPGESWQYSGGGYTVLQQAISDLVRQPFARFMQQLVLDPLGMTHSTYRQPLPVSRHRDAASAYGSTGERIEGAWHVYPEMAAAGLWTTPSDLAHYVMNMQDAYHGRRSTVLSQAMVRQMLEPHQNGWGLGPTVDTEDRTFGHGGSNAGFRATMLGFLDIGEGAIIMTNSDNGGRLAAELLGTIAHVYGWPARAPDERVVVNLTAAACRAVAGAYRIENGPRVTVECRDAHVWIHPPAGAPQELLAASETEFFSREDGTPFVFTRTDGEITNLTIAGNTRAERIRNQ